MRRFVLPLMVFIAVVAASFQYWQWRGRPVALPDLPGARFQCLSYSPFEGTSGPLDRNFDVPRPVIARDMELLKTVTGCLRTYSSLKVQGDVTRIAHEHGLKVLQGIWISDTPEDNDSEIAAALALVRAYPGTIKGIFVGNEVLLRREMTGEALARLILRVKAESGLPVFYADVPHFFKKEPAVVAAVDSMAIHILPYWDDPAPVSIDAVQAHVAEIVGEMRALFPGKPMMIGEIGWPSAGRTRGAAVPSLVNQARFVREFVRGAGRLGIDYNLIEAIDQPWKRVPEGTVGGYWGIFSADRVLKFPLTGPVVEWPRWRTAFAISLVLAGLLMGAALWRGRVTGWRWVALGALAGVAAISLVQLFDSVRITSLTAGGWVMGGYFAALTVLAALALTGWIEGRLQPGAAPLEESFGPPRDLRLWPGRRVLGAGYWIAALPVGVLALAVGFDGRHRDLPFMGLWLPGLALALLCRGGATGGRPRRAEAWLSVLFILGAVLAFDGVSNIEMALWSATMLLFALAGLGDIAGEARYLVSGAVEAGGAQQRQRHGDGGDRR